MNKEALLRMTIEKFRKEQHEMEKRLETVRQAAIDAPGAMQSHSDTTKSQMSRLAEEMAGSIVKKRETIRALESFSLERYEQSTDKVQVGSLVEVESQGDELERYIILPGGAGLELEDEDGINVLAVSPDSPLAGVLLGRRKGSQIKFQVGQKIRELKIMNID